MAAHDAVASKYPTESMVKAASTPDFSIRWPPRGIEDGRQWEIGEPWQ